MATEPRSGRSGPRLFAFSFTSLFLELMVIRWVPAEIRLVAYYANLMLVSSFLGLGIGAMVAARTSSLLRWFPFLLLGYVGLLMTLGTATLPTGPAEWRFQPVQHPFLSYLVLVGIFLFNAALFIPLGQQLGRLFNELPTLRAYTWDLLGSLCGTLTFGFFSLYSFSPQLGFAAVVAILLLLSDNRQRLIGAPAYALMLLWLMVGDRGVIWSPYYAITVQQFAADGPPGSTRIGPQTTDAAETPPEGLRTMHDPPLYLIRVNQDFYQFHGTIDLSRYTPGTPLYQFVLNLSGQYGLPLRLPQQMNRVLVLGAGGGMDAQTAILQGAATRVDAVEIDPVIRQLSRKFSAAGVYHDPRVFVHVDDARAFLQKSIDRFDAVVFGFLDSQALSSYASSLRLDGFTYTVESFRRAYGLLNDGGVLSISFYVGHDWMGQRLVQMAREATGRNPIVYASGAKLVILVPKGETRAAPAEFSGWQHVRIDYKPVDLATDDWPYLYLQTKAIPNDYLLVIGTLLVISLGTVLTLRRRRFGSFDAHFLFLGLGFLLLQTKSIGDCALYFGNTWFVTMIVIAGVLLMVLAANLVALRLERFFPWLYGPLLISLVALAFVPREWVLTLNFGTRLAWALLAVPLPIFFAGLIFSTTFRDALNPSELFGANLVGATIGGFCEYLGMWTGTTWLSLIIIAAYLASLGAMLLRQRGVAVVAKAAVAAGG